MEENVKKSLDFLLDWPQLIQSNHLLKKSLINQPVFTDFLSKFSKLLRWRQQTRQKNSGNIDETTISQVLCYTDQLLLIFNNANACVQLQAAKLLLTDEFRVLRQLLNSVSIEELDIRELNNAVVFNRSLLLVECSMLNCLSVFPLSEFTSDSVKLLLSLLYSHLEKFPNIAGSHGLVMWITIQSVVDAVYHLLNFSESGPCITPSMTCIKTIEAIAVCSIQMLKISAKAVLSKFHCYMIQIQKQSLILDDIEIQSFLNFIQSEPCYNKAIIFPICQYMKDVLILNENRVAFMQWNAPALISAIRDKHKDPTILTAFDDLISTLTKPAPSLSRSNTEEILIPSDKCVTPDGHDGDDEPSVNNFDYLTSNCYSSFDLFICVMKHFVLHTKDVLCVSTELLTAFTVRSVTMMLGFVRDTMSINEDIGSKIVAFMAKNAACLPSIVELINHWRVLIEFPHFGNAVYGILMTGSNDDRFCLELGRSEFLYWIMSFLNVGVTSDMLKFGDIGHLLGNLVVVFSCAQRPELLHALEMVSTLTVLPFYAQCSNLRLKMLAKFTLSYMDFALFDVSILRLSRVEVDYVKNQLTEAVDKGSTSHWYAHHEILQVLINLIKCDPKNAHLIIQLPSVMNLLIRSMYSNELLVQKKSLEAFMNFHSFYKFLSGDLVSQSKEAIEAFSTLDNSDMKNSANCAQFLLKPDTSPEVLLQLIECCYKCKLFEKCIELTTLSSTADSHEAHLYKAKCLYSLYRREHEYLRRHYELLNKQVADQKTSTCYSKAEECIRLLSVLLDNDAIDVEGSRMLDQAMLDYIHKTNKLNKLRRCLLCRTKTNLKRSHLWPKSFLKRYSLHTKGDFSSRIFVLCTPECYKEKSPGEVTYWMLCGKCEQRLSQNGEDKFSTNIFEVICSDSNNNDDEYVSYGPWLYNFMIGMLFRSFIFFDLTAEHNAIFLHCRHHLLSLPVKYAQEADNPVSEDATMEVLKSPDSHCDITKAKAEFLSPFLLINPTKLDVDHPRKSMLVRALFDAGSAKMSTFSLQTGKHDLSGQHHFITIRLGNLNFLLKLKASTDYVPPPGSLINPSGGKLFVPAEKNRWDCIPEGLWVAIDKIAEVVETTSLRHYAYKVSAGTWKPSDSPKMQQLPYSCEEDSKKERLMHSLLKQKSDNAYSSFVSRFLHESQPSLTFLPKEFKFIQKYSQTHRPHLELPDGHTIIYHVTLNFLEANLTTFLVACYETAPRFIAIIIEQIQGVQLAYGAHVEYDSDQKVSLDKPLIDLTKISDHHRARFKHYCNEIGKNFNLLLEVKRVYSLEVLAQRVYCTKAKYHLMSFQPVDLKCIEECWYCEDRCQHCLLPASLGYSLRKLKGGVTRVIKFCKTNPCYAFYTSSPDTMPTFVHLLPHSLPESELLLQVTKLIATGWSSNTILIIQLCVNKESFNVHKGELYVLMQFCTASFQGFFDFFISMNYKPIEVLQYMKHKQSTIMDNSTLFMLMLKLIIEDVLQATPYHTLEGLLQADQLRNTDRKDHQLQDAVNEAKEESTIDAEEISSLFQPN